MPGRSGPANGRESTADENVPVPGPLLVESSCFTSCRAKLRLDGTPTRQTTDLRGVPQHGFGRRGPTPKEDDPRLIGALVVQRWGRATPRENHTAGRSVL